MQVSQPVTSSWKVQWEEFLRMSAGMPAHELHTLEVIGGDVLIRDRLAMEDLCSWANDGVLPERALRNGEVRPKAEKKKGDGNAVKEALMKNLSIIENLVDDGDFYRGRCPSCAEAGRDRSGKDFWVKKETQSFGCHNSCESAELFASVAKKLGIDKPDTSQEEQKVETESDYPNFVQSDVTSDTKPEDDPSAPGVRVVKNSDHQTVEHILLDSPDPRIYLYKHLSTSKATGREEMKEEPVKVEDVKALWNAIVSHVAFKGGQILGGSFLVGELWEAMGIDRTSQSEKYRRWNHPANILMLLGVIEKQGAKGFIVRRAL